MTPTRIALLVAPTALMLGVLFLLTGIEHWIAGFGSTDQARLMLAQGIRDGELAALELAIRRADREGAANEVRALAGLRDRLLAAVPGYKPEPEPRSDDQMIRK